MPPAVEVGSLNPWTNQGSPKVLIYFYHKGWFTKIFLKILFSSWSTFLPLHTSSPSFRLSWTLSQTPRSFSLSQLLLYYLSAPNPSFFALLQDTGAGPRNISFLSFFFFFLTFWLHPEAWGILVPPPRIEPAPPALEGGVLTIRPLVKSLHEYSPLTAGRTLGSVHRGQKVGSPTLSFRAEAQLPSHQRQQCSGSCPPCLAALKGAHP